MRGCACSPRTKLCNATQRRTHAAQALRVKLEERDNRIATLEMESQAWTSKSAQQAKDSAECFTLVKEELDLTRASLDTAADECRGLIMKLDERNREMRSKTLEVQKLKDQNALLTERLQLAETDVQKTTAIKDGMEEDTRRMVTEIERQLGLECAERSHLQRQNDILSDMLDVTQDELTRAEIELEIYRIQAAGKDSPRSKKGARPAAHGAHRVRAARGRCALVCVCVCVFVCFAHPAGSCSCPCAHCYRPRAPFKCVPTTRTHTGFCPAVLSAPFM